MRSPRWTWVGRALAVAAAISMGLAACSSSGSDVAVSGPGALEPTASVRVAPGPDTGFVGVRGTAPTLLESGQSCDDVLEDFQAIAPDVMPDDLGFQPADTSITMEDTAARASELDPASSAAAGPDAVADLGARAAGSTSDTNTHEAGIDEPDVVETDGDFVYLVDGDQLVILDGATAEVLSRTQLMGPGGQLLLSGDRLLVITSGGHIPPPGDVAPLPGPAPGPPSRPAPQPAPPPVPPSRPAPPPVPPPPSFQTGTVLQLLDVSDRAAPTTVQTTELEGQHVSTRVVDGVARVVVSSYPQPYAHPLTRDMPTIQDGAGVAIDPSVGDRTAIGPTTIEATTIEDWLPSFRATDGPATGPARSTVEGALVDCEDVFVPEVNAGLAQTSVLRVDFDDGFDPDHTTTVVAEASTVYASATKLYIAADRHVWASGVPGATVEPPPTSWSTAIHAFDLGGEGAAAHVAAGEVPGHTLNQYSMSEHDGHLRVATTEGAPWSGGDSESAVRVLRIEGDELVEVGAVGGLGVTETIQSVRFMGPVAYVVTFRQTDPLYVIDLSEPTEPAAVGELKIPGFSSYLHPLGDGRLLGVGRDVDLEGVDRGLLVSLFDVSDPTDPRQIQTYTERDAHSAAGQDPKAFLWWSPASAVVIPIERYGPAAADPGGYGAGMLVLDVDDAGITERATVTADGRFPSRALVVQGRLWSVFDGGVVTAGFDGGERQFHPFR